MEGNILLIGGTGTLGRAFLNNLANNKNCEITVLSRDEQKHHNLSPQFKNVKFIVGDIRDVDSIESVFFNKEIVIHTAAMKHINICEKYPMESVKTNIIGSHNVAKLCVKYSVDHCIFSSTDKAVDPVSVYGYSKAIAESIFLELNSKVRTNFSVYRWGNILFSNGSFLYKFIEKIVNKEPVPITDLRMTRFFLKIEDAVNFVNFSYRDKSIFPKIIPDLRSAKIVDIAIALGDILDTEVSFEVVGLRCNEKLHENLVSQHINNNLEYVDSNTAPRLSREEIVSLIKNEVLEYAKKLSNNW